MTRFHYRCRLCRKIDVSLSCGDNKSFITTQLVNATLGEVRQAMAPTLTSLHFCKNGNTGISDLLGAVTTKK